MVADRRSILVGPINETGIRNEAEAAAAITPGNLVELTSAGKLQKQATASVPAESNFAIEDSMQGHDYEDDYATGARVQAHLIQSGQQVWAILADGEDVAIGDKLEPAGGGELKKAVASSAGVLTNPAAVKWVAMEAIDAASSVAVPVADRRIIVRRI